MSYSIRRSIPADRPEIETLFVRMLQSIYHTAEADGYEEGYLDKFYQNGEDWICVAEIDRKIAGYLSIEVHRETETPFLYLDDCSVDEAYRNQGIGTAMLTEAERFAAENGIPAIMLHVEADNTAALRLYQRLGFGILAAEGSRYRMIRHHTPAAGQEERIVRY